MDDQLVIDIGGTIFEARFEASKSPLTCRAFARNMPLASKVVHVRWSGEAVWVPLGDKDFDVPIEDATAYPSPGDVLLYPGGKSETEILIAYGSVQFASKAGVLAGNHFATITSRLDELSKIGPEILWNGSQDILFNHWP